MLQFFHSFQVGSTVYYVLDNGPCYRIRKTSVAEITKHPASRLCFEKYYYHCEDGYRFESLESLRPSFVFTTRQEAISFVIERLRSSMEYEKSYIITARQRLEQLQASLRVYSEAAKGHENAPASLDYAFYIDDDEDRYVIRRTSLSRIVGDLGSDADFNALGCRDLGNGLRLSYICPTKEEAAYRITQFLGADIARQKTICANAEASLEQTRRSLKVYQKQLSKQLRKAALQ